MRTKWIFTKTFWPNLGARRNKIITRTQTHEKKDSAGGGAIIQVCKLDAGIEGDVIAARLALHLAAPLEGAIATGEHWGDLAPDFVAAAFAQSVAAPALRWRQAGAFVAGAHPPFSAGRSFFQHLFVYFFL